MGNSLSIYASTNKVEMCFQWESYRLQNVLIKNNEIVEGCSCYCRHYARLIYDDLINDKLAWKFDDTNKPIHRKDAFEKHVLFPYSTMRETHTRDQQIAFAKSYDVTDMSYAFARKNLTAVEGYETLITLMNCKCCSRHDMQKPNMDELYSYTVHGNRFIYPKEKAISHLCRIIQNDNEIAKRIAEIIS